MKKNIKNIANTVDSQKKIHAGVIGAGNHAVLTFLPVLKKSKK